MKANNGGGGAHALADSDVRGFATPEAPAGLKCTAACTTSGLSIMYASRASGVAKPRTSLSAKACAPPPPLFAFIRPTIASTRASPAGEYARLMQSYLRYMSSEQCGMRPIGIGSAWKRFWNAALLCTLPADGGG